MHLGPLRLKSAIDPVCNYTQEALINYAHQDFQAIPDALQNRDSCIK